LLPFGRLLADVINLEASFFLATFLLRSSPGRNDRLRSSSGAGAPIMGIKTRALAFITRVDAKLESVHACTWAADRGDRVKFSHANNASLRWP
jgi:hypothetical protein